jgi:hypothetical protein
MAEKRHTAFYVKVHSSEPESLRLLKKITEVGNDDGHLWIFFQPFVSIATASVPENLNMGPYWKTPLVPLFLAGTVHNSCFTRGKLTT